MIITQEPCDNTLCSCQYDSTRLGFKCTAPHLIKSMIKSRANLHEIIDLKLPGAEIGVASGVFSLEILQWGISCLYMVDVWQTMPGIRGMASDAQEIHDQNFKDAAKRAQDFNAFLIKGLSSSAAKTIPDNSLGFVYIDACHEYDYVIEDLRLWVPKLVNGGVCALHDYGDPGYGVGRAVREFTNGKYKVHELPENGAIENMGCYFINK